MTQIKNVFMFPGHGSQFVGMGKDLFAESLFFRELIELASDFLGEDLKRVALKGPELKLRKAKFLQPVVTSVSLGYAHELMNRGGVLPSFTLGHSLGEITALGISEVLTPEDTVKVSAKRGELMDRSAENVDGTMYAYLFSTMNELNILLEKFGNDDIFVANDNAPSQIVLSARRKTLKEFAVFAKENGGGMCKEIPVSGPWHSSFMNKARNEFAEWVKSINFRRPRYTQIFNAIGKEEDNPQKICVLITNQLVKPVYWSKCMEYFKKFDVNSLNFYEIGPGKVLSGLLRANKIRAKNSVINSLKSTNK